MFRILIMLLGVVTIGASLSNGEVGAALVAAVIVAVLLFMGSAERKEMRARSNWVDYWAGRDRR